MIMKLILQVYLLSRIDQPWTSRWRPISWSSTVTRPGHRHRSRLTMWYTSSSVNGTVVSWSGWQENHLTWERTKPQAVQTAVSWTSSSRGGRLPVMMPSMPPFIMMMMTAARWRSAEGGQNHAMITWCPRCSIWACHPFLRRTYQRSWCESSLMGRAQPASTWRCTKTSSITWRRGSSTRPRVSVGRRNEGNWAKDPWV